MKYSNLKWILIMNAFVLSSNLYADIAKEVSLARQEANKVCVKQHDKATCGYGAKKEYSDDRPKNREYWSFSPVLKNGKGFVRVTISRALSNILLDYMIHRLFLAEGKINDNLEVTLKGLNGVEISNIEQKWYGELNHHAGYITFDYEVKKNSVDPKFQITVSLGKSQMFKDQMDSSTAQMKVPFNPYIDTLRYINVE